MDVQTSYQTLHKNSIKYMLKHVEEYEQVKSKLHPKYKFAREFFQDKAICFQNFYKFYNRFIASGRNVEALLPIRRGPKPKYLDMPNYDNNIVSKVLYHRANGHNRYVIAEALKRDNVKIACSASTVYRIFAKYGVSKLQKVNRENKRKLVRDKAGSLLHIDCHYLPKGVVKSDPLKRYYTLGVIDNFSRIAWVEVIESTKAIDVCFAMMDSILSINQRYGIKADEVLTDNGSEFCSGSKTSKSHPFERLLSYFNIKHRRTKPYRPQTNGKIERFWRTFDDEVIEGSQFETLADLKNAILGYNFYYNEYRPHQGINGKIPIKMLDLAYTGNPINSGSYEKYHPDPSPNL